MLGKLDEDLPELLVFLADELNHLYIAMDCWEAYQSMVLQGFTMAFAYNSNLVFQWLTSTGMTEDVLRVWFGFMRNFEKAFELRRVIFGLSAILRSPKE